MSQTTILSRVEVESMGPPVPEEIPDLGIGEGFLCDLALKHVAMLPEPTTTAVGSGSMATCLSAKSQRKPSPMPRSGISSGTGGPIDSTSTRESIVVCDMTNVHFPGGRLIQAIDRNAN